MKSINLLFLLLIIPIMAFSQNADDYFHEGANLYIKGSKKQAKEKLMEGINLFPDDERLRNLAALIKEEEEKEEQDMKDQQQQNQEKEEQQQEQQQNKQDNQEQQQEKQQAENEKEENKEEEKQDQQAAKQGEEENQEDKDKKEVQEITISKDDAIMLLEALENEEKEVQKKLSDQKAKGKKVKVEKDW